MELLKTFCTHSRHIFWEDSLTLLDSSHVKPSSVRHSGQITDTYLLALAASRSGQLATFDLRLTTDAVPRAAKPID